MKETEYVEELLEGDYVGKQDKYHTGLRVGDFVEYCGTIYRIDGHRNLVSAKGTVGLDFVSCQSLRKRKLKPVIKETEMSTRKGMPTRHKDKHGNVLKACDKVLYKGVEYRVNNDVKLERKGELISFKEVKREFVELIERFDGTTKDIVRVTTNPTNTPQQEVKITNVTKKINEMEEKKEIKDYTDKELADELKSRGYAGTLTKVTTLTLE